MVGGPTSEPGSRCPSGARRERFGQAATTRTRADLASLYPCFVCSAGAAAGLGGDQNICRAGGYRPRTGRAPPEGRRPARGANGGAKVAAAQVVLRQCRQPTVRGHHSAPEYYPPGRSERSWQSTRARWFGPPGRGHSHGDLGQVSRDGPNLRRRDSSRACGGPTAAVVLCVDVGCPLILGPCVLGPCAVDRRGPPPDQRGRVAPARNFAISTGLGSLTYPAGI